MIFSVLFVLTLFFSWDSLKGMSICSLANLEPIAESFYYVNYGSSFIMSKVRQIISVIKNKNWCFQKNDISKTVHFGILIHVLSWRQQKHHCLCFHYWDYLSNIWRNNWRSRKTRLMKILLPNFDEELSKSKISYTIIYWVLHHSFLPSIPKTSIF